MPDQNSSSWYILYYTQSWFAVIRVPEWTTSTLESTISTLAEVSNQSLVFYQLITMIILL